MNFTGRMPGGGVHSLVITEAFSDGLPPDLEDDPLIVQLKGRFDDNAALDAAGVKEARVVVVLAEPAVGRGPAQHRGDVSDQPRRRCRQVQRHVLRRPSGRHRRVHPGVEPGRSTHVGFSLLVPTPHSRRDRYVVETHDQFHRFLERMIPPPAVQRWADRAIRRIIPSVVQAYLCAPPC